MPPPLACLPACLRPAQDPERQGPPSRQGSALVNGINWSDRRMAGPPGSGGPGGGGPGSTSAFARSRSMPHPEGLFHDPSLNAYLGGCIGAVLVAHVRGC